MLADDDVPDISAGAGWNEGTDERYRLRLPEKAVAQIVATAIPLAVDDDIRRSARPMLPLWLHRARQRSLSSASIRITGKVIGTLTIDRAYAAHFPLDGDVRFLTMVANLIGQTVQLHRAVSRDRDRLMAERHRLQKALLEAKPPRERKGAGIEGIIGDSALSRALLAKVEVVAKSRCRSVARPVPARNWWPRRSMNCRRARPFIKMNCAALPETVLESELFGHEQGAFTDAVNARKGRFKLADKGTFFLDGIGEISAVLQAKLLRVLQEQEFERVGGTSTIKVNVRIVAAINKNLEDAVSRNEFRSDLYFPISVLLIALPPLRERPNDIPLLAAAVLKRFNAENERSLNVEAGAIEVLKRFPGNVRELETCVQRTATLAYGPSIVANDFACRHNECLSSILWKVPSELPHPDPLPPPASPVLPAVTASDAAIEDDAALEPVTAPDVARAPKATRLLSATASLMQWSGPAGFRPTPRASAG